MPFCEITGILHLVTAKTRDATTRPFRLKIYHTVYAITAPPPQVLFAAQA